MSHWNQRFPQLQFQLRLLDLMWQPGQAIYANPSLDLRLAPVDRLILAHLGHLMWKSAKFHLAAPAQLLSAAPRMSSVRLGCVGETLSRH